MPLLRAELEGEEVEEARRLYALLRQQLADLRQTSLEVRRGGHEWKRAKRACLLVSCGC